MEAASVEYPLALPAANPLSLTFAVSGGGYLYGEGRAVRRRRVPHVFMNACRRQRIWSSRPAWIWRASPGTSIRLRFEARDSTGEAQWVEPAIVAGNAPAGAGVSAGRPDSRSCWARRAAATVQLWPGSRGVLDAPVGLVCGERRLFFRGFRVRVAGDSLEEWRSASELLNARRQEPAAGRYRVRHRFRSWAGAFDVLTEMWVDSAGAFDFRFWLENEPVAAPVASACTCRVSLPDRGRERAVRVYAGPGNVIQDPQAFRLDFDGHHLATSFVGFDFANGVSLLRRRGRRAGPLRSRPAGPLVYGS